MSASPGRDRLDDAESLLAQLVGPSQMWLADCRAATRAGADATLALLDSQSLALRAFATQSRASWRRPDPQRSESEQPDDLLLEEEPEDPLDERATPTADVSAARSWAYLAQALTGARDIPAAVTAFLAHADRAGLHSIGTQLVPAGTPLTADETVGAVVLEVLGRGHEPGRGYAILAALELTGHRPPQHRAADIRVLFSSYGSGGRHGEVGVLQLRQLKHGPSGLHPDPAKMAFLQADSDFTDSLEAAWRTSRLATTDACVVWSVIVDRAAPANAISGSSLGAALAVALDDLAPKHSALRAVRPRRIDSRCAVTAGLDGTRLTSVSGYPDKLAAAQRHNLRVVIAADGVDMVPAELRVDPAATLEEAIGKTRTRLNTRLLALALAALLVVTLVAGTVAAFLEARAEFAREQRESNARLLAGASDSFRRTDPALSQQLALSALRTADSIEARSAVLNSTATDTPLRMPPTAGESAVASNQSGSLLATGDLGGQVRLSSVDGGRVAALGDFDTGEPVLRLAVSPDAGLLVSVGPKRVTLWDIAVRDRATKLRELDDPRTARASDVAFSSDNRQLAIGTDGTEIARWDLDDRAHPVRLPSLEMPAKGSIVVAFSPDGRALMAGSVRHSLRIWDLTRSTDAPAFEVPAGPALREDRDQGDFSAVTSLAFGSDGTVAIGESPPAVRLWHVDTNDLSASAPVADLPDVRSFVYDVVIDAANSQVAALLNDQTIRVWTLRSGRPARILPASIPLTLGIRGLLTFVDGGAALASRSTDGVVRIWRRDGPVQYGAPNTHYQSLPDTSATLPTLPPAEPRAAAFGREDPDLPIRTVAFSPTQPVAAVRDMWGPVALVDIRNPQAPVVYSQPIRALSPSWLPRMIEFAPTGTLGIIDTALGSVSLWDLTEPGAPRNLSVVPAPSGMPIRIAFSNRGLLAVGTQAGVVHLYDIRDPRSPRLVHNVQVFDTAPDKSWDSGVTMAFTADGSTMAVTHDHALVLYDVSTPDAATELSVLAEPGDFEMLAGVGFNPQGTRVAAGARDGKVRVWDVSNPRRPRVDAVLTAGPLETASVNYRRDGAELVVSGRTGRVQVWQTDPRSVAADICASGTALLTQKEWDRYLFGVARPKLC